MPINLSHEQVLTLRDATRFLPRYRKGRRVHVATLYRWASAGIRGIRLETLKLGGRIVTSEEALQRFADRCSSADPIRKAHSSRKRRREIERAKEELDRAGI